jgi:hypothetical protein
MATPWVLDREGSHARPCPRTKACQLRMLVYRPDRDTPPCWYMKPRRATCGRSGCSQVICCALLRCLAFARLALVTRRCGLATQLRARPRLCASPQHPLNAPRGAPLPRMIAVFHLAGDFLRAANPSREGSARPRPCGWRSWGARVALLARSEAGLDRVAARISGAGGAALTLPADLADPDAVVAATDRLVSGTRPPSPPASPDARRPQPLGAGRPSFACQAQPSPP